MKKLHTFTVRSFVGPFAITFCISIFLLVMQFFWKYIDDLMGKGLDTFILLELLFYVSLSIIPLALPLAVLISSIMTLGNLAENNELTALKASGLSLYRVLAPLFFTMIFLAIGTLYFSNYVLPIVNLKWRWIMYDIQQQKPTFTLDEGEFYYEFDGYAIKAEKIDKENSILEDIVIYDHKQPRNINVIKAKKGKMYNSSDEKNLFLALSDGRMYKGITSNTGESTKHLPFQKSKFAQTTLRFDLSDFVTNRSNEEIFKNNVEMLNLFQLQNTLDSMKLMDEEIINNFSDNLKKQHEYFKGRDKIEGKNEEVSKSKKKIDRLVETHKLQQAIKKNQAPVNEVIKKHKAKINEIENPNINNGPKPAVNMEVTENYIQKENWDEPMYNRVVESASIKLRNRKGELTQYIQILDSRSKNIDKYKMEWHRKFTLSVSVLVLFCIGAPFGAIIRKGGLGMPIVVSVFLFIVYYILLITGQKMVKSQVLVPWIGMWLSTFILAPIAFFILYKASNDSQIFRKEAFLKVFGFFKIFKRLNLKKNK